MKKWNKSNFLHQKSIYRLARNIFNTKTLYVSFFIRLLSFSIICIVNSYNVLLLFLNTINNVMKCRNLILQKKKQTLYIIYNPWIDNIVLFANIISPPLNIIFSVSIVTVARENVCCSARAISRIVCVQTMRLVWIKQWSICLVQSFWFWCMHLI